MGGIHDAHFRFSIKFFPRYYTRVCVCARAYLRVCMYKYVYVYINIESLAEFGSASVESTME